MPRADVELFGWRQVQVDGRNEWRVETRSLALKTDDDGQLQVPIADLDGPGAPGHRSPYQWVVTARTPDGRLAYQGFSYIWGAGRLDPTYDMVKAYAITDRPVYRPGGPVKFKFWVAHARYDQPDASEFAGQGFLVEVRNPKGDKVFTGDFKADAFGGFDGSFELPSDATLGAYQVFIPNRGGVSFRVEEYKKPEFEVNVEAPSAPVMLGEKVAATIKANYYFGAPVSEAKVKYKVTRTIADARWYPSGTLGLALRLRLLVVRPRFVVVSRLVALGRAAADRRVVGASPIAARGRRRGRAADPARRDAPRRDRHRDGQGRPSGPGPSL